MLFLFSNDYHADLPRRPGQVLSGSTMSTFSAEDDLDVVWPRVVERVQRITKWELSAHGKLSPDEIVEKINPPKRDDGSTAKQKAKTVLGRTLVCIETFGQVVASAAGMVRTSRSYGLIGNYLRFARYLVHRSSV